MHAKQTRSQQNESIWPQRLDHQTQPSQAAPQPRSALAQHHAGSLAAHRIASCSRQPCLQTQQAASSSLQRLRSLSEAPVARWTATPPAARSARIQTPASSPTRPSQRAISPDQLQAHPQAAESCRHPSHQQTQPSQAAPQPRSALAQHHAGSLAAHRIASCSRQPCLQTQQASFPMHQLRVQFHV